MKKILLMLGIGKLQIHWRDLPLGFRWSFVKKYLLSLFMIFLACFLYMTTRTGLSPILLGIGSIIYAMLVSYECMRVLSWDIISIELICKNVEITAASFLKNKIVLANTTRITIYFLGSDNKIYILSAANIYKLVKGDQVIMYLFPECITQKDEDTFFISSCVFIQKMKNCSLE